MADHIMGTSPPAVQRTCAGCGQNEDERIRRNPLAEQISSISTAGNPQRKCAKCAEEEEQVLQTKATGNSRGITSPALVTNIQENKGKGQPLDKDTRSFMQPRFGADFGNVRIHSDHSAAVMSQHINAKAFTVGNDIFFNKGQYNPDGDIGKRLLAHELTHVIQQSFTSPKVQRMTIGTGTPPAFWVRQYNARVAPADELDRVNNAIGQVREVATHPDAYSSCHDFYEKNCPGGTASSLQDTFNQAVLWKADRKGALAFADAPGTNIAYTQSGYRSGARPLANTLIHEMMHNCGISGDKFHHLADAAGQYCIGNANQFSIAAGPAFNANVPYILYSYRRFLTGIGNGQLELRAGLDLNLAATAILADTTSTGEIGGGLIGLRGRSNLWGAERFGGLTGNLETGLGIGRFKVRDAETDTTHPEFGAGYIVQAGLGAEFYIPIGATALPLSIEATYRLVVPLNEPAEAMHGILGSVGLHF